MAFMLTSVSGLQFIVAQAPHSMKGILIGLYYFSAGLFTMLGAFLVLPFYFPFQNTPFAVFIKMPPTQLGTPVQVIRGLNWPYCIAINSDSELIVSEIGSHKISVYTRRGEKKHEFGSEGEGKGEFWSPISVAVDKSDGCIFVADGSNNRIQKFTRDGHFMKLVGGPMSGNGPMQFNYPRGLKLNTITSIHVLLYMWYPRIQQGFSTLLTIYRYLTVC